jgi:hypothetical protein
MATAPRTRTWTAAIAQDGAGRHYFVSPDGERFRQVQHFPVGATQAETLFEERRGADRYRIELERDFEGRISFMSVIE